MNERIKVTRLTSKTESVEMTTSDGKYRITGEVTRNPDVVTSINNAQVIRDDGWQMASITSWTRHGQMSVSYNSSTGNNEVQNAIEEFISALQETTEEEGGMA